MQTILKFAAVLALPLGLAACEPVNQADLGHAAAGGIIGAGAAGALGGDPVTGAVIGAGAGLLCPDNICR